MKLFWLVSSFLGILALHVGCDPCGPYRDDFGGTDKFFAQFVPSLPLDNKGQICSSYRDLIVVHEEGSTGKITERYKEYLTQNQWTFEPRASTEGRPCYFKGDQMVELAVEPFDAKVLVTLRDVSKRKPTTLPGNHRDLVKQAASRIRSFTALLEKQAVSGPKPCDKTVIADKLKGARPPARVFTAQQLRSIAAHQPTPKPLANVGVAGTDTHCASMYRWESANDADITSQYECAAEVLFSPYLLVIDHDTTQSRRPVVQTNAGARSFSPGVIAGQLMVFGGETENVVCVAPFVATNSGKVKFTAEVQNGKTESSDMTMQLLFDLRTNYYQTLNSVLASLSPELAKSIKWPEPSVSLEEARYDVPVR
jgi:hypothetical protein